MKAFLQARSTTPSVNLLSRISMAAALLLVASAPAAVAQVYDFTFTSGGMDATGSISIVSGVAQIGSISVTGVPLEANPSMFTTASGLLLPASGPTDAENHDGDVITYDNLVNLSGDPVLNGNGLGFGSGPYQDSTHYNTVVNLWGNGPGSYSLFVGEAQVDGSGNVIGDAQWVYHTDNGSLTLTAVAAPEPTTISLVAMGLLGAWAVRRRKV